ncbi:GGDEF/EAL domain protein YhjH [Citrobacter freundii]|uniref:GGDEF/EAL domain protein YhjH n=1 Tax=Citrobacter freundii TaxID=546 RepID=A0A7G2IRI6_CITFR|nr:GGDEF/EAL domain protein YhjH [Citrobacter freundii]
MIKQVTQQLITLDASIENLQERRYWLQCERAYTYQPIYQTNGRLMAVELLTVVSHPDNPSQRIAPDRYFAEVTVRHRVDVVIEQLLQLELKGDFFQSQQPAGFRERRRTNAHSDAPGSRNPENH